MWDRLKRIFGGGGEQKPAPASPPATPAEDDDKHDVKWLDASTNPWGVPVLDVRPLTLSMLSLTKSEQIARNAVSYGGEDGSSFAAQAPPVARTIACELPYRIDRMLADGVLFKPSRMEHKWGIFACSGRIVCVRSWLREVHVTAELRVVDAGRAEVTSITGVFREDDEPADLTVRTLDYLLRTHALAEEYPLPWPETAAIDLKTIGMSCMSFAGNMAHFVTPEMLPTRTLPDRPLRSVSLLHLAVVDEDEAALDRALASGIPLDLCAVDGLTVMHWAQVLKDTRGTELLLSRGADIDMRGDEGSTALMTVVQRRDEVRTRFLLDRGADASAADARGFTSLHRAAEMGELAIARLLLERGATRDVAAEGHTPLSLAQMRGEKALVELLGGPGGG
jgi:hypothetical protein